MTPRRWRRALVEVLVVGLGVLAFVRLHAAVARNAATATADARALQSVERALHLAVERPVNAWLVAHPALIPPAVYCYRLYYVAILGVLVWVFVRHAEVYPQVRRTLLAMTFLALPVFWALPMSPPRFALPRVVDVVALHDIVPAPTGHATYTAMPSLHVGWSAWCAYGVWSALRAAHPRAALLAWLFPLLMTAVVVTTGNHYVLDVVGSAVLFGAAVGVARCTAAVDFERARTSIVGSDR